MLTRDVMTIEVVTVTPETPVPEIARRLLERRIGAVPVVDPEGRVVGIVSEGDLVRRLRSGPDHGQSWWLALLAGTEDFGGRLAAPDDVEAAHVMTKDVVTVTEETPVERVAAILEERRIKRVPVVRAGRLVGIVSRADLLRGLASRSAGETATSAEDRLTRERLMETLRSTTWASPAYLTVIVQDGVVHLWGSVSSDEERAALRLAARSTQGVRELEDHLVTTPPAIWAE